MYSKMDWPTSQESIVKMSRGETRRAKDRLRRNRRRREEKFRLEKKKFGAKSFNDRKKPGVFYLVP